MENSDLFIPVILGTARKDRRSEAAARYVHEQVQQYGVKSDLIDVKSMLIEATIPSWVEDDSASEWRQIAQRADGFVFIVPEYNRTLPGELKLLIDRAKSEYLHKPVVACGVANSDFGGARVVEHMLPIWVTLQMVPVKANVFFSNASELFNESGQIQDTAYDERVVQMMDELTWYAKALKDAKEGKE